MTSATEADFEADVFESGVNVYFKPTRSYYTFIRLSENKHAARSAPLSRDASVRHVGPSGDTGEYDPAQVLEMAYQVAARTADRKT